MRLFNIRKDKQSYEINETRVKDDHNTRSNMYIVNTN